MAIPLYTGSVDVPSTGTLNVEGTPTLNATGANTLNSNTTGSAAAFILNNNNGTPTTGDLLDVQKGGVNKFQIQNSGSAVSQSTVTAGGGSGSVQIGGTAASNGVFQLSSASGADYIIPESSGRPITFSNAAFTANNVQIPDAGGIQCRSTVATTLGYLPPTFTHAGANVASTLHAVSDTVVAAGASTTVTLAGAAVFTSALTYTTYVFDATSGAVVTSITGSTGSQFTFSSTNTHQYNYFCIGT